MVGEIRRGAIFGVFWWVSEQGMVIGGRFGIIFRPKLDSRLRLSAGTLVGVTIRQS